AKNVVAAALYGRAGGARDQARQAVLLLADVATHDTDAFGEVYLPDGHGGWSNRTATPHVWEGALFYLAAMALTDPSRCNQRGRLPLPAEGGGCSVGGRGGGGAPLLLLVIWRAGSRSRRSRPPARRSAPRAPSAG